MLSGTKAFWACAQSAAIVSKAIAVSVLVSLMVVRAFPTRPLTLPVFSHYPLSY